MIGGGLEADEDPIESIKREALEEAQIKLTDVTLISVVTFKENSDDVLMICYQARTNSDHYYLKLGT